MTEFVKLETPTERFIFMLLGRIEKLEELVDSLINEKLEAEKERKRELLEEMYNCKLSESSDQFKFGTILEFSDDDNVTTHIVDAFKEKLMELSDMDSYSYDVTRFLSIQSSKTYELLEFNVHFTTPFDSKNKEELLSKFDTIVQENKGSALQSHHYLLLSSMWMTYDIVQFHKQSFMVER